jgi:XTP/dITP diphosphohydrolase
MDLDEAAKVFQELVAVVKALRTPGTGCPWDLEQDHKTLRPYLVEETQEVLDAIDHGDDRGLREELGDLLLQVILHAQVADDRGAFSITEVVRGITEKMVRRHPHVFGSVKVSGSDEVRRNWEQIKAAEKQDGAPTQAAALARLPEGLPALLRAQRLGEKAAKMHLDWSSVATILDEVRREFSELQGEIQTAANSLPSGEAASSEVGRKLPDELHAHLEHELGDVLFSLCQLARWLGLSAEDSLRACNRRFVDCFRRMEQQAQRPLLELSREEVEAEWQKAKGASQ